MTDKRPETINQDTLYDEAMKFHLKGNYSEARKHLKPLADKGDYRAQYRIAFQYYQIEHYELAAWYCYLGSLPDNNPSELYEDFLGDLSEKITHYHPGLMECMPPLKQCKDLC